MSVSADVALSRQLVLQRDMQTVNHNLSNFKTPGFQAKFLMVAESQVKPTFKNSYSFVEDLVTIRDVSQGRFVNTGNPLHVYINGHAYFAVQAPQGTRYTRSGVFTLNEQNELVTPEGHKVLNQGNGAIVLPEGSIDITIGTDGVISDKNGQIEQLGLFSFKNEQLLKDEGYNLMHSSEQPTTATENVTVGQFGYEGSNVNEITQTTLFMEILREFQQVQKFIEEEGHLQSKATQSLLKISSYA